MELKHDNLAGTIRRLLNPVILAAASVPAVALAGPLGGEVIRGEATIVKPDDFNTVVNQASNRAVVNWQTFSVGGNEYVIFNQPSASSVILNRVIGNSASEIFGSIEANGRVFLVNPNGIFFGEGATLDVNGLVASTLDIDSDDFMDGRYVLQRADGAPDGEVRNAGTITAQDGGFVVLAGDYVENTGVIAARLGHVALASGDEVTLDMDGAGLINFAVNGATLADLAGVRNAGDILADGSIVIMTAQVARDLLSTVVNNEGLVLAQSVEDRGGVIYLNGEGGHIENSGALIADAAGGGDGGLVFARSDHDISLAPGGLISADGGDDGIGGTIRVVAEGHLGLADGSSISATGGTQGGFVEVSGHGSFDLSGDITIGNGGNLLIDPETLTIVAGAGAPDGDSIDSTIGVGFIEGQLNGGTHVRLVAEQLITAAPDVTSMTSTGDAVLRISIGQVFNQADGAGGIEPVTDPNCTDFGICTWTGPAFVGVDDFPNAGFVFLNPLTGGQILLGHVNFNLGGSLVAAAHDGVLEFGDIHTQNGSIQLGSPAGFANIIRTGALSTGTGVALPGLFGDPDVFGYQQVTFAARTNPDGTPALVEIGGPVNTGVFAGRFESYENGIGIDSITLGDVTANRIVFLINNWHDDRPLELTAGNLTLRDPDADWVATNEATLLDNPDFHSIIVNTNTLSFGGPHTVTLGDLTTGATGNVFVTAQGEGVSLSVGDVTADRRATLNLMGSGQLNAGNVAAGAEANVMSDGGIVVGDVSGVSVTNVQAQGNLTAGALTVTGDEAEPFTNLSVFSSNGDLVVGSVNATGITDPNGFLSIQLNAQNGNVSILDGGQIDGMNANTHMSTISGGALSVGGNLVATSIGDGTFIWFDAGGDITGGGNISALNTNPDSGNGSLVIDAGSIALGNLTATRNIDLWPTGPTVAIGDVTIDNHAGAAMLWIQPNDATQSIETGAINLSGTSSQTSLGFLDWNAPIGDIHVGGDINLDNSDPDAHTFITMQSSGNTVIAGDVTVAGSEMSSNVSIIGENVTVANITTRQGVWLHATAGDVIAGNVSMTGSWEFANLNVLAAQDITVGDLSGARIHANAGGILTAGAISYVAAQRDAFFDILGTGGVNTGDITILSARPEDTDPFQNDAFLHINSAEGPISVGHVDVRSDSAGGQASVSIFGNGGDVTVGDVTTNDLNVTSMHHVALGDVALRRQLFVTAQGGISAGNITVNGYGPEDTPYPVASTSAFVSLNGHGGTLTTGDINLDGWRQVVLVASAEHVHLGSVSATVSAYEWNSDDADQSSWFNGSSFFLPNTMTGSSVSGLVQLALGRGDASNQTLTVGAITSDAVGYSNVLLRGQDVTVTGPVNITASGGTINGAGPLVDNDIENSGSSVNGSHELTAQVGFAQLIVNSGTAASFGGDIAVTGPTARANFNTPSVTARNVSVTGTGEMVELKVFDENGELLGTERRHDGRSWINIAHSAEAGSSATFDGNLTLNGVSRGDIFVPADNVLVTGAITLNVARGSAETLGLYVLDPSDFSRGTWEIGTGFVTLGRIGATGVAVGGDINIAGHAHTGLYATADDIDLGGIISITAEAAPRDRVFRHTLFDPETEEPESILTQTLGGELSLVQLQLFGGDIAAGDVSLASGQVEVEVEGASIQLGDMTAVANGRSISRNSLLEDIADGGTEFTSEVMDGGMAIVDLISDSTITAGALSVTAAGAAAIGLQAPVSITTGALSAVSTDGTFELLNTLHSDTTHTITGGHAGISFHDATDVTVNGDVVLQSSGTAYLGGTAAVTGTLSVSANDIAAELPLEVALLVDDYYSLFDPLDMNDLSMLERVDIAAGAIELVSGGTISLGTSALTVGNGATSFTGDAAIASAAGHAGATPSLVIVADGGVQLGDITMNGDYALVNASAFGYNSFSASAGTLLHFHSGADTVTGIPSLAGVSGLIVAVGTSASTSLSVSNVNAGDNVLLLVSQGDIGTAGNTAATMSVSAGGDVDISHGSGTVRIMSGQVISVDSTGTLILQIDPGSYVELVGESEGDLEFFTSGASFGDLALASDGSLDVSGSVFSAEGLAALLASGNVRVSGADIEAGTLVITAGGDVLNQEGATLDGNAMLVVAGGDIALAESTIIIGTGTIADLSGDSGSLAVLAENNLAPASSDPNAAFITAGSLQLGSAVLNGSYLYLQAGSFSMAGTFTGPSTAHVVQATPFNDSAAILLQGTPAQGTTLIGYQGFLERFSGATLLVGNSAHTGDISAGEPLPLDIGSANLLMSTAGETPELGEIVTTGLIGNLEGMELARTEFQTPTQGEILGSEPATEEVATTQPSTTRTTTTTTRTTTTDDEESDEEDDEQVETTVADDPESDDAMTTHESDSDLVCG